jgi:hypothetical protein
MRIKICVILGLCIALGACNNNTNKQEVSNNSISIDSVVSLPPLVGEELFLKNKTLFGKTIELQGKQIIADTVIFKVREAEFLVKNDRIIIKSGRIMMFQYPEMIFLGYRGKWGNGPDEFIYPHIVPTADSTLLCYLFESTNSKLYQMDRKGNLSFYPFSLSKSKDKYSEKQVINIAPNDFIYVGNTPTGKSIFRATSENDSTSVREVYNLALNPKRKSPFAYIGDFAVNAAQNRMVYAYKYFKIIKFMDMEAKTIKTINFEREQLDESTLYKVDGLDQNTTHYWGVSAQNNYVYFLYSGRTPVEVMRENNKNNHYIYVEQYDWNGNPVNKFKLDQWGYFTVDEANKKIYLLSTNHDDPLFVYDF